MEDVLTVDKLINSLKEHRDLYGENTKVMFDNSLEDKKHPIKRVYVSYDSENGVSINLSDINI